MPEERLTEEISITENSIIAQGISKVFVADRHNKVLAVDKISFTVNKGEIIVITGPNGSGKTTLLTMIGCLASPTEGTIKIFNNTITCWPQKKLTRFRLENIGFIFQTFRLLDSLNVFENVELVAKLSGLKKDAARDKANEALKKTGMADKCRRMISSLSGGEMQKAAIARAIVINPPLILADEPTGSLDSASGHSIIELLCSISKEAHRTVIIVSHDERIRHYADRVIMMEDGQLRT